MKFGDMIMEEMKGIWVWNRPKVIGDTVGECVSGMEDIGRDRRTKKCNT